MYKKKPTTNQKKIKTKTILEVMKSGADELRKAGKEDAEFESKCIAEHVKRGLYLNIPAMFNDAAEETNSILNDEEYKQFVRIVQERTEGEPLQYLLGEWEFMGLPFKVGKGVLIPRPETEMLVEFAIEFLKGKENPIVFDLCSGSGCIAISVAEFCPDSTVYAIEKSDDAFEYLLKNIELNNAQNVKAIKGDIFDNTLLSEIVPDLILSNPPYIRSGDMESLQTEVKKEPTMALDGGEDGYDFYRVIASDWIKRIKKGGMIAVECAEDQTEYICELFSDAATSVKAYNDYSRLPRGVIATI